METADEITVAVRYPRTSGCLVPLVATAIVVVGLIAGPNIMGMSWSWATWLLWLLSAMMAWSLGLFAVYYALARRGPKRGRLQLRGHLVRAPTPHGVWNLQTPYSVKISSDANLTIIDQHAYDESFMLAGPSLVFPGVTRAEILKAFPMPEFVDANIDTRTPRPGHMICEGPDVATFALPLVEGLWKNRTHNKRMQVFDSFPWTERVNPQLSRPKKVSIPNAKLTQLREANAPAFNTFDDDPAAFAAYLARRAIWIDELLGITPNYALVRSTARGQTDIEILPLGSKHLRARREDKLVSRERGAPGTLPTIVLTAKHRKPDSELVIEWQATLSMHFDDYVDAAVAFVNTR